MSLMLVSLLIDASPATLLLKKSQYANFVMPNLFSASGGFA
jgi:hypothetical protein